MSVNVVKILAQGHTFGWVFNSCTSTGINVKFCF